MADILQKHTERPDRRARKTGGRPVKAEALLVRRGPNGRANGAIGGGAVVEIVGAGQPGRVAEALAATGRRGRGRRDETAFKVIAVNKPDPRLAVEFLYNVWLMAQETDDQRNSAH